MKKPDNTTADLRAWRKKVGRTIHARRARQGLSLQKLAAMAGIRPERLDLFEIGRDQIDPQQIARIAAALGVGFEEICS